MAPVKMLWGPASVGSVSVGTGALTGNALNDADNTVAWSFCIPKDGTITDIGFYINSTGGTPPAYNTGIVTLDTAGRPTTTPYGGSSITSYTPTATGWKWVTLNTSATANAGDFAAVYIYPSASTPNGTNNITVVNSSVCDNGGVQLNYTTAYTTGATASTYAIKYSDGSIHGIALSTNTVTVQVRSNTTPDEVGCVFQVPAQMVCYGAKFHAVGASWGSAATLEVVLYDASNNVLATTTVSDKDFLDDSNTNNIFFDGVTLSANTNYRLALKPTTGTSGDIYTPKWTFESTAALAAIPCGDTWQYTSRVDAGSWTDDNVSVCPMGLWVSNIDFSGGTVTSIFTGTPYSAEFPASNYPQLTLSNRRPVLAFDASTDETAYWTFIVPQGGVGTSLTCIITYAMASATSGSVYWQAQLEAITPGDATDTDAATSFDTANSGNGTVPGTAGYVGTVTITMTNADNIAAADLVRLSVNRDADHGSDTATGDAYLLAVELRSA